MTKNKAIPAEREYIINLRREIMKVPRYRRTPKAIKAIKQFIAKHMRVPDRDLNKVKIDKWLNQEMWFRGIQNPLAKIKVKAKKDGENIIVSLVDIPEKIKFQMVREEKSKKASEKVKEKKKQEKTEVEKQIEEKPKSPEEIEKEKQEEKEKEEAVKEAEIKQADLRAKEQKHVQKIKPAKTERIQRKALQK
ncbi:50S ribosomal protein L31e [Candidatus Pacearchaeota archaeon]|nr:50S ribosomal protein L31e [Candidatus Pacearchaeota archaeon]